VVGEGSPVKWQLKEAAQAALDEKQYGDKCRYRGSGPNQPQHQKEPFPVHQPTYGPGLGDGYFPLGRAKIKLGAGVYRPPTEAAHLYRRRRAYTDI
jgi:hypothetical protein